MEIRNRHVYSWLLLLVVALLGVSGWRTLGAALQPPAVQMVRIEAVTAASATAQIAPTATPGRPVNQIALPSATATSFAADPLQPIAYGPTLRPTVAQQPTTETAIILPTITPEPAVTPIALGQRDTEAGVALPPIIPEPPARPLAAPKPVPANKPPIGAQHYNGTGVPIMMYHHIAVPPADADAIRIGLSVTPSSFAAQLDYLNSHGYQTITLARYVEWATATRLGQPAAPLPANPIVLTFDDGYDDIYANAYPLLHQHGMVGTFNIITGKVGWQGYLTWPQLQEMSAAGMDIESHTVNHVDLDSLDPARLDYELAESKQQLDTHLGVSVSIICYPSGRYDWAVEQAAQRAGYIAATTTRYGWSYPGSALFELPRVRVAGDEALAGFVASIGGTLTYKENR